MIIVYDTSSAESRNFHNRRSLTCGMQEYRCLKGRTSSRASRSAFQAVGTGFGATSASRWHCGYENSA
ncbi:MAG: hypothetical protein LBB90_11270, partial [Tannerella sp.]|nr:hypothetical protein [Tannerella sp.]